MQNKWNGVAFRHNVSRTTNRRGTNLARYATGINTALLGLKSNLNRTFQKGKWSELERSRNKPAKDKVPVIVSFPCATTAGSKSNWDIQATWYFFLFIYFTCVVWFHLKDRQRNLDFCLSVPHKGHSVIIQHSTLQEKFSSTSVTLWEMGLHFYNLELHHAVGISESNGPKEEWFGTGKFSIYLRVRQEPACRVTLGVWLVGRNFLGIFWFGAVMMLAN
jgi:hypothetical protein